MHIAFGALLFAWAWLFVNAVLKKSATRFLVKYNVIYSLMLHYSPTDVKKIIMTRVLEIRRSKL